MFGVVVFNISLKIVIFEDSHVLVFESLWCDFISRAHTIGQL